MANIDRADWHYGGDYPEDLPPENGGTHIGMFLAWVVSRDLASKEMKEDAGALLAQLRQRGITGRELLYRAFDEKFFDSLLTKVGRDFVRDYYETDAYVADYDTTLAAGLPTTYHVADTWENYDRIAAVIDRRFDEWLKGAKPPPNPARAAQQAAQQRFFDVVSEAATHLKTDPAKAAELLERFLERESDPVARASARRELGIIRTKHLKS